MDAHEPAFRDAAQRAEPGSVATEVRLKPDTDVQQFLKAQSGRKLKCAWSAGAEDLCCPTRGLPEGHARQIFTVTDEVRGVVDVERFADEGHPQAPAHHK